MAGKENLGFLTGKGATKKKWRNSSRPRKKYQVFLRVHHIMTDYVGPRLMIDLHINVDGTKTLNEVHEISDGVIQTPGRIPRC